MAKVIQIVESDDESLLDGTWHATVAFPYPHTVCGVQLEGEDGVVESAEMEGRVTCQVCRAVISEIQKIRGWR